MGPSIAFYEDAEYTYEEITDDQFLALLDRVGESSSEDEDIQECPVCLINIKPGYNQIVKSNILDFA